VRELEVGQPLAARIVALALPGAFVLWTARVLALALLHHQDVSGAPAAIGMAVFAGALGYRLATLSLRARGQELVIHNYWRTRHVPISQIEGIDIGRATGGSLWTVRILANGSIIPIDVLGSRRSFLGGKNPGAVKELECRRTELADWLATATCRERESFITPITPTTPGL
jgi:hypothetical protein